MLRRSLFGPRFKANSLSISGQRKNPARRPKLRDVKKQVKAVQESESPIKHLKEEEEAKAVQESQSPIKHLKEEEEEEAKAVQESQSPIKHLKEEEEEAKAVQESQSPIQLEKEEEAEAVQESQSPIKLLKEEHCEVCAGTAGSHPSAVCPYLHHVPSHVMSVGKGYRIACRFCRKGEKCVDHLTRYAIRLSCMRCGAFGLHTTRDYPERRVKGILMPSVRRRVRVTTTFHARARHPLLPQRIGTFSHPLLCQSGHGRSVFE